MFETLRSWLNGKRDYFEGIILYKQLIGTANVFAVLSKGETAFSRKKLNNEMMKFFVSSNRLAFDNEPEEISIGKPAPHAAAHKAAILAPISPLYEICQNEAKKKYKEVMNLRAILFYNSKTDELIDMNTPERVASRCADALKVVAGYQLLTMLYAKSEYVAIHNQLPIEAIHGAEKLPLEIPLPVFVKAKLDNLRKAASKLRLKPPTPERIQLLETHLSNITKLELEWHSLKHQQPKP